MSSSLPEQIAVLQCSDNSARYHKSMPYVMKHPFSLACFNDNTAQILITIVCAIESESESESAQCLHQSTNFNYNFFKMSDFFLIVMFDGFPLFTGHGTANESGAPSEFGLISCGRLLRGLDAV